MSKQLEKEEEYLQMQLERGEITLEQYNKEIMELARDERASAEDAAREAYEREMNRYY